MSRLNFGVLGVIGALLGLSLPGVSHGEDGVINDGRFIGLSNDLAVASTRPGALLAGLKGRFDISIAHVGASDFGARNAPRCGPVRVRIDRLYDMGEGNLGVEPGLVMTLDPWSWQQETFPKPRDVPGNQLGAASASDGTVAFRLVSERPRRGCNVVASGLFYPASSDGQSFGAPVPFALLPSVSVKKASKSHDRR